MQKEEIGQRVQARPCFLVAAYDWLLAQVTARHDESFDGGVEQQLVKRCVGQHDAEAVVAGGHAGGYTGIAAMRQENNRAACALEERAIGISKDADAFGDCPSAYHDGKSFAAAALPFAQKAHAALISGVADEVESAEALDCQNPAIAEKIACAPEDRGNVMAGGESRRWARSKFVSREQGE